MEVVEIGQPQRAVEKFAPVTVIVLGLGFLGVGGFDLWRTLGGTDPDLYSALVGMGFGVVLIGGGLVQMRRLADRRPWMVVGPQGVGLPRSTLPEVTGELRVDWAEIASFRYVPNRRHGGFLFVELSEAASRTRRAAAEAEAEATGATLPAPPADGQLRVGLALRDLSLAPPLVIATLRDGADAAGRWLRQEGDMWFVERGRQA